MEGVTSPSDLVINRDGVHVKSSNADSREWNGVFAVRDGELEMVVEIELVILETRVRGRRLEAHGISTNSVIEFLASHENRQLIE